MRGLRLKVLECLVKHSDYEYSIAKELGENFSTIRKILISFKKYEIARFVGYGPREAKMYEVTELGKEAYEVAKNVEDNAKLIPIEELVDSHGSQAVKIAIRASLIEPIEREEPITKIGPDAPPPISADQLTIRRIICDIIDRGNKRIRSMRLKCPYCGYVGPAPKWVIFPQIRAIASNFLGVFRILCPECNRLALIVY